MILVFAMALAVVLTVVSTGERAEAAQTTQMMSNIAKSDSDTTLSRRKKGLRSTGKKKGKKAK
jgi:hypothetical protein